MHSKISVPRKAKMTYNLGRREYLLNSYFHCVHDKTTLSANRWQHFANIPSAVIVISVILHIIKKNSAGGGKAAPTTLALEEIIFLARSRKPPKGRLLGHATGCPGHVGHVHISEDTTVVTCITRNSRRGFFLPPA